MGRLSTEGKLICTHPLTMGIQLQINVQLGRAKTVKSLCNSAQQCHLVHLTLSKRALPYTHKHVKQWPN